MDIVVIAISTLVFVGAATGVRSGRNVAAWTGAVAAGAAGIAAGVLMMLDDASVADWTVAVPTAAVLGVANVRALFAGEGPFRT